MDTKHDTIKICPKLYMTSIHNLLLKQATIATDPK